MDRLPPYYVYILSRNDGRPFYVGKGVNRRIDDHEKEAAKGCPCHKCRVIRKIQATGASIKKEIVYRTDDEMDAYYHEAALIGKIGLCNLTNVKPGHDRITVIAKPRRYVSKREYLYNLREIRYSYYRKGMKQRKVEEVMKQELSRHYDFIRSDWRKARRMLDDDESDRLMGEMISIHALIHPMRVTQLTLDI